MEVSAAGTSQAPSEYILLWPLPRYRKSKNPRNFKASQSFHKFITLNDKKAKQIYNYTYRYFAKKKGKESIVSRLYSMTTPEGGATFLLFSKFGSFSLARRAPRTLFPLSFFIPDTWISRLFLFRYFGRSYPALCCHSSLSDIFEAAFSAKSGLQNQYSLSPTRQARQAI